MVTDAQPYDPFTAFDDVVAGTTRDPYPALVEKRRDTPLAKGFTMSPDVLPEGFDLEPGWIAYRYEDCSRILRDAKTFTSTGYDTSIGMVMGHMILGMDDPEHRTHRNLVAHAFREKSLARWEPEFIGPIVDEQIDRFAEDGAGRARPPADFRVPGAGHRPPARPARRGLPPVPALVDRAHRPGGRHRPRAGGVGVPAASTSPASSPIGEPIRPKTSSATWSRPRWTASGSPTRPSTPSCGCCSRPGRRRRTGPRATSSTCS